MKGIVALLAVLALCVSACGIERHGAEVSLIAAERDYQVVRDKARSVAPDQAKSIEDAIALAKQNLDANNIKLSMAIVKDLRTRLRELSDRLPAMQTELETAWKTLDETVPVILGELKRQLSPSRRPPPGFRRKAFDAAKLDLYHLMDQWGDAQVAMKAGRLAEAVGLAEGVKSGTAKLATLSSEGS